MSIRMHVHLKVRDLAASREFYERFFGDASDKIRSDQLRFRPYCAPLNLALSAAQRGEAIGVVNYFGTEVDSIAAVERYLARVKSVGLATRDQLYLNCCYANQTKLWVCDPDGIEWEVYHVNHDLMEKHGGGIEPRSEPTA